MRVALAFWGLTRSLAHSFDSINKNILEPLKLQGIIYHIYMHTYSLHKYDNERANEHMEQYHNNQHRVLNPDFLQIDDQKKVARQLDLSCNYDLAMYSKSQVTRMIAEPYDYIIYLRPDLIYINPIDTMWLSSTKEYTIILSEFDKGSYNRFAITNMSTYKAYGDIFDRRGSLYSDILVERGITTTCVPLLFARARVGGRIETSDIPVLVNARGGLCNKLRVVLSYYQYAKSINTCLVVCWEPLDNCTGFFLDYFEPIKNIVFVKKSPRGIPVLYHGNMIHPKHANYMTPELKPLPHIMDEINAKIALLKGSYDAIHVRRTDHITLAKDIGKFTEDEDFFKFIDASNKKYIYLATDNKETYDIYKSRYPDKIVCPFPPLVKGLRQTSLKDSIIDLYTCVYAIDFKGCGWSSFTDTISLIRMKAGPKT